MKLIDKNLYYIGGVVRDEILELPSFDIDFCYEGNAIEFAKNLNVTKTNPDFGTVRVMVDGQEIDIASTRTESYPNPGHLPIVENIGCSLRDDLFRRDFTINALAKNTLTGDITDYFGGIEDIKNRKLRVLHNKSFIDDPSRILRALKFSVRFGFDLEANTKKLQEEYLANINYDMSYHRIKKELKETFNLNKQACYNMFVEQNIYKLLGDNSQQKFITGNIESLVNKYKPKNVWLIYLGLFDLSSLELTSEEQSIIDEYRALSVNRPSNDFEIYRLFKNKPLESILLYSLSVDSNIGLKYLDSLSNIKIETTGKDLLSLGLPQGDLFKEILSFLEEKKVQNPNLTKDEELELVKGKYIV